MTMTNGYSPQAAKEGPPIVRKYMVRSKRGQAGNSDKPFPTGGSSFDKSRDNQSETKYDNWSRSGRKPN